MDTDHYDTDPGLNDLLSERIVEMENHKIARAKEAADVLQLRVHTFDWLMDVKKWADDAERGFANWLLAQHQPAVSLNDHAGLGYADEEEIARLAEHFQPQRFLERVNGRG